MSSPFSQHNQQPFQPQQGAGGYPQQGGYPQGGNQQGGYPQQSPQVGYGASPYGQPAYPGGPMGPQPSGSNNGKIIAIITGSFVVALVVAIVICGVRIRLVFRSRRPFSKPLAHIVKLSVIRIKAHEPAFFIAHLRLQAFTDVGIWHRHGLLEGLEWRIRPGSRKDD